MAALVALSEADVLQVWEAGNPQPPAGRALVLLAAALPDADLAALADLTIGERDELLLDLRQGCFGSRLDGRADCPRCAEALQVEFDADQLRAAWSGNPPDEGALDAAGHRVRFRLPTSRDALGLDPRDATGPRRMLARCVLEASTGATPVAAEDLGPEVLEALAAAMTELDARIDIRVALVCPGCEHSWAPALDLAAYLWAEIDVAARRLLHAVHTLALAYGWTETDTLAVGPWRRQAYLQAVTG